MTSHWPHKPKLFPKKMPQTYGKKILEIADIDMQTLKEYITENCYKLI